MLSSQVRLRLEFIADRIAKNAEVPFDDMVYIQKWASHNRSAYEILQRARRRSINGEPEPGSMDELLDGMNLGFADPDRHITSDSSTDDFTDFFKAPPWTTRD